MLPRLPFTACALLGLTSISQNSYGSRVTYGYSQYKAKYEDPALNDDGTAGNFEANLNVHEFILWDSSGKLGAALDTAANKAAAEAGAINEERRKVAKGESSGGPKILTYQYERAKPQQGSGRRYGLRLGSNKSAFSSETLWSEPEENGTISYAEISLVGFTPAKVLLDTTYFAIASSWYFGFRWGGYANKGETRDLPSMKHGYAYVPLGYQLSFLLPFSIKLNILAGIDPISAIRHYGSAEGNKPPIDNFVVTQLEYTFAEVWHVGLKNEIYKGFGITDWSKGRNKYPHYEHEMLGAYVAWGL